MIIKWGYEHLLLWRENNRYHCLGINVYFPGRHASERWFTGQKLGPNELSSWGIVMIRWWNDPAFDEDQHQSIIFVDDDKYAVACIDTPMYRTYVPLRSYYECPIIGPNEMSRWENDDAT